MIAMLFRQQRLAMTAGMAAFVCFLVTAVLIFADPTEVMGVDRWIKPAKFFISIAIYMWTIGFYLHYLPDSRRFSRRITWAMIVIFIIEMAIICGQAARGVKSHFNIEKPVDGALYTIMGLAIVLNTILAGVIAYRYFKRDIELAPTLVWGLRLGLVVFLIGSVMGGYMSAQTGHTVGALDGGPGLPFVNWSTVAGDLRVAHFLGLHGLQAVPIVAFAVNKLRLPASTATTAGFAAAYLLVVAATFVQALAGRPLIP